MRKHVTFMQIEFALWPKWGFRMPMGMFDKKDFNFLLKLMLCENISVVQLSGSWTNIKELLRPLNDLL